MWVLLFIGRVTSNQPNVDDYLYTILSSRLLQHGVSGFFRGVLMSGPYAPLYLVGASPLAMARGVNGAAAFEFSLLILTAVGAYLLVRVVLDEVPATVVAVAVVCNQAVLGWSLMVNFALAATAMTLWSLGAYMRSDHLRRPAWSLVFGVSFGLLMLSRSLAPVYVAPMAMLLAIDLVLDGRHRAMSYRGIGLSAVAAAVIALPWWIVSGRITLTYLLHSGYQVSAFAHRSVSLTPFAIYVRIRVTFDELGHLQETVLAISMLVSIAVFCVRRKDVRVVALPSLWVITTVLLLSTSSNSGTGFGLPVVAVTIAVLGIALARLRPRPLLLALFALVLGLGVIAEWDGSLNPWWLGPPYRDLVLRSGGNAGTNVVQLTQQVSRAIQGAPTVVARDDDLVNANGLSWDLTNAPTALLVPPYDATGTAVAISLLPTATYLIAGSSPAPYHGLLNEKMLVTAAVRDGYQLKRSWREGPGSEVQLWFRTASGRSPGG